VHLCPEIKNMDIFPYKSSLFAAVTVILDFTVTVFLIHVTRAIAAQIENRA
jgi:hypothetical protein